MISRLLRKLFCKLSVFYASDLFGNCSLENEILLTFDDGPHPKHTLKILEYLEINNIRAIFFVTGVNALRYPWITQKIVECGHVLANHTFDHKDVMQVTAKKYFEGYVKCENVISAISKNTKVSYFRPPRGLLYTHHLTYFLAKRVPILLWTKDSRDSQQETSDKIVEMLASIEDKRQILLFHDDSSLALEILEKVLPIWLKQGFALPKLHPLNGNQKFGDQL